MRKDKRKIKEEYTSTGLRKMMAYNESKHTTKVGRTFKKKGTAVSNTMPRLQRLKLSSAEKMHGIYQRWRSIKVQALQKKLSARKGV